MKEKAQAYLSTVLDGIIPNGFSIASEVNEMGTTFIVTPKIPNDYAILIGYKGRNSRMWRNILKTWCKVNARGFRTNVLVPNPTMVKDETNINGRV